MASKALVLPGVRNGERGRRPGPVTGAIGALTWCAKRSITWFNRSESQLRCDSCLHTLQAVLIAAKKAVGEEAKKPVSTGTAAPLPVVRVLVEINKGKSKN